MPTMISEEQRRALAGQPDQPLVLVDPESNRTYVLVRAEVFERVRDLLDDEFRAADAYPAVDRAFAVGWDDPKMDDYDRYDELKR